MTAVRAFTLGLALALSLPLAGATEPVAAGRERLELDAAIAALTRTLAELRARRDALGGALDRPDAELEALRAREAAQRETIAAQARRIAELEAVARRAAATVEADLARAAREVAELRASGETMAAALAAQEACGDDLERRLALLAAEVEWLAARLAELEK